MSNVKLQDLYVRQLYIGCDNGECKTYFCKNNMSKASLLKVGDMLANYGEYFLCSTDRTSENVKIDFNNKSCPIIDFYIYAINKTVNKKSILPDSLSKHNFCSFFKKSRFNDEEKILIEGVLSMLLEQYINYNENILSHIIIRLLSEILLKLELKDEIFENISEIFLNIDKLCKELELDSEKHSVFLDSTNYCQKDVERCSNCLFNNIFTESDLKNLIQKISIFLNRNEYHTIRSSKKIEELLNIFHILFCINEKVRLVSFKDFYLEKFCENQNLKEEIRLYKANYKTIVKHPFILPLNLKADFIKSENNDMMKNKLQDAFFRALFIGETSPYFFITVNRNTLYKDIFRIFTKTNIDDILKEIKITFKGEEGVDSGGITKEFFQLVSESLIHDRFLFRIQNNVLWFAEGKKNNKYEVVGKLIGVALYNDVVLNLPFPTFLFKIFLDKKVELDDLMEIEPEICQSLKKILEMDEGELDMLEQYFYIARGTKSVELIPKGKNVLLTKKNKELFVEQYVNYLTCVEMKDNIDNIKNGFITVIRLKTINFLQPCELEKIIVGTSFIDVQFFKKTAVYSGFSESSFIVKTFWKIFEEYSKEDKKKLLMFITGNERVPVTCTENWKLIIVRNGCDTDRLPSSQTCFNTLLLPEYSSEKTLRNKLGIAISMTKGFFLL